MNEVTWVDVLYVSLHQKYTLENWDPFTGMETNTVSNELLGTIVIMRHLNKEMDVRNTLEMYYI